MASTLVIDEPFGILIFLTISSAITWGDFFNFFDKEKQTFEAKSPNFGSGGVSKVLSKSIPFTTFFRIFKTSSRSISSHI